MGFFDAFLTKFNRPVQPPQQPAHLEPAARRDSMASLASDLSELHPPPARRESIVNQLRRPSAGALQQAIDLT